MTLLCTSGPLFAQTTWNGSVNTSWTNAANWSAGVPDAADVVTIPDVTNNPTISAAGALANSISVQSGGVLTISAAGTLTVSGGVDRAIQNFGTVSCSGAITIGAAVSHGIQNHGIFSNTGGQVSINNSTTNAIFNNAGTFTNTGAILIGNVASAGSTGIYTSAVFNNNTGGQIKIDRTGTQGIRTITGSTFTNHAIIIIGASASPGQYGMQINNATFSNNTGGQISIDRSTSTGIFNNTGSVFENQAILTIGGTAEIGERGMFTLGTFTNKTGGQVKIDRFSKDGIYNEGIFTNEAIITVGSIASTGTNAIYNRQTFDNNTGSQINIDRSALVNGSGGTFSNRASIVIGATVSPGSLALSNYATFNNYTGGFIKIDRSTSYGINNAESGTFTNHAAINVGTIASAGGESIQNNGIFNHSAGQININNSTSRGITNMTGATFTNLAGITIGPVSGGSAFITNKGNFIHSAGQINMNGSANYGLDNEAGATFTNTAAIKICETSGTTASGIQNFGTFDNNAGSSIQVDRSTDSGILNGNTFTNAAGITLGSIAGTGRSGIYNRSGFSNNTGGLIKIDRCANYGIDSDGTFTNNATLTIGKVASVGTWGIRTLNHFTNFGQVNVDRTTEAGIAVIGGTTRFYNHGTLRIGGAADVGTYGIYVTNGPAFSNEFGGQIHIDRAGTGVYGIRNAAIYNLGDITIGAVAPIAALVTMPGDRPASPQFYHHYGTLKGSGSFSSGFQCRGGTLAPGNSPGIMTIESPAIGLFDGVLAIEVDGKGVAGVNFDQIVALGDADLTRIKLALSINYIPTLGDQITILRATTVKGPFEEITGLPENWFVHYTATAVILTYGSVPLPVTLVSFSGKKTAENQNTLKWITADEKDFDRFEIQRSADAKEFETIGVVLGQGAEGMGDNPGTLNTYIFTDLTPAASNYYRLKLVDRAAGMQERSSDDGSFQYSRIMSIENSAEQAVVGSFYPNPSSGKVFVDVYAVESGSWTLTVIDAGGKTLGTGVYDLQKGMNKITLNPLSPGMNLVRFERGLFSEVRKLVRE